MQVEIWSDVVCPWCYVGKRRFERALGRFSHAADVEVVWKSFQLDPHAPSVSAGEQFRADEYAQRLAAKYGTSVVAAQRMIASMTAAAAIEGLDFRFDRAVRANTFDAHQLLHLARRHGLPDQMKERLLRAYFCEGAAVGDRAVLEDLAVATGLPAGEVRTVLSEQTLAPEVLRDQDEARVLGITAVPFFVVDRTYGVAGAQPADALLEVLQRAWADTRPLAVVGGGASGSACGPDGCAV